MEMEFTVLGAKSFNDSVEGVKYNSTKLFVMLPEKVVSSDSRNVVGFNAITLEFGLSDEFVNHKMASLKYPLKVVLDVEPSTKGFTVHGFKPVHAAQLSAAK